jgi:hypothetical protein
MSYKREILRQSSVHNVSFYSTQSSALNPDSRLTSSSLGVLLHGAALPDEGTLARGAGCGASEPALGGRPELGGETGRLADGLACGVHFGWSGEGVAVGVIVQSLVKVESGNMRD